MTSVLVREGLDSRAVKTHSARGRRAEPTRTRMGVGGQMRREGVWEWARKVESVFMAVAWVGVRFCMVVQRGLRY